MRLPHSVRSRLDKLEVENRVLLVRATKAEARVADLERTAECAEDMRDASDARVRALEALIQQTQGVHSSWVETGLELRARVAELEALFQQTHGVHVSWVERVRELEHQHATDLVQIRMLQCLYGAPVDSVSTPRARLDPDGTAKPLTEIAEVFDVGNGELRTLFEGAGNEYVVRPLSPEAEASLDRGLADAKAGRVACLGDAPRALLNSCGRCSGTGQAPSIRGSRFAVGETMHCPACNGTGRCPNDATKDESTCPMCGWPKSSHVLSQHGLACPWGVGPGLRSSAANPSDRQDPLAAQPIAGPASAGSMRVDGAPRSDYPRPAQCIYCATGITKQEADELAHLRQRNRDMHDRAQKAEVELTRLRSETAFTRWTAAAFLRHVQATGTHEERKAARILSAMVTGSEEPR